MTKDYTECNWALQCLTYNASNPCEKPSCRLMRKPKCYVPKKQSLIPRLAERVMKDFMHIGGLEE